MRLLILGGTEFVGRAVSDEALTRGWEVTLFNRGRLDSPPGVTALRGDRTEAGGLAELGHGTWDIVLDTWTGAPSAVRDSARLLSGRAAHYVYVSSRSVYEFPAPAGLPEEGPVVDADPDDDSPDDYARAKRGGELAALDAFGERALLARAGLVLGPRENVGRLPWWLARIARGGPVLAPGPRDLALQYIDARDLAAWALDAAERGIGGAFNAVGPSGAATIGDLLEACVDATGSDAELRWTEPERILAAGIAPWTELPVWAPPGDLYRALHQGDVSRALAAGLRVRPVAETVADTWSWMRQLGGPPPLREGRSPVGLDPERETRILREARILRA
ncbi:NAD-dependent epimerase/dehydratase family protein [Streptacidiphilus sp. 4-A2]|nr:NAD-dependent epimerase/dehydratase family protein [Streptacidiphilus sp. 4-A2]